MYERVFRKRQTWPYMSDADRIPAETAEVFCGFSSCDRFAKIQPGWLSEWIAGRVFFVVIIDSKAQQAKTVYRDKSCKVT